MKALAVAFVASVVLTLACFGQQETWHSEGRDEFLVAPYARQLKYVRMGVESLTYMVVERYPAMDVVAPICRDFEQKGWQTKMGCPADRGSWKHIPGALSPYQLELFFVNRDGDQVEYGFDYDEPLPGERDPKILHVRAEFIPGYEVEPPPPRPLAFVPIGVLRVLWLLVGVGVILAPIVALQSSKVTSLVFYAGPPDSLVTSANLIFFSPVLVALFGFGVLILLLQFEKTAEGASIAGGIAGVAVMSLIGKISIFVCPALLFLTYRTLSTESIPRKVKTVHSILNLGSIAFFGFCGYLAYFAHLRLINW